MKTIELKTLKMNSSNKNRLNLLDLPNEIFLLIINELPMIDVLYSLVNIHPRFDQLIFDPLYIGRLNLTSMRMKSYHDCTYAIDDRVVNRICKNVLLQIHDQVHELIAEPNSMKRVLCCAAYPQLHSLSLIDFQEQLLLDHVLGKLFFLHIY